MRKRLRIGLAVAAWAAGTWAVWTAVPVRPRGRLELPYGERVIHLLPTDDAVVTAGICEGRPYCEALSSTGRFFGPVRLRDLGTGRVIRGPYLSDKVFRLGTDSSGELLVVVADDAGAWPPGDPCGHATLNPRTGELTEWRQGEPDWSVLRSLRLWHPSRTRDGRLLVERKERVDPPVPVLRWVGQVLGVRRWTVPQLTVWTEVRESATDRLVCTLAYDRLRLSPDGRILLSEPLFPGEQTLIWDIPPRKPFWLVAGLSIGWAMVVGLVPRWLRRQPAAPLIASSEAPA